LPRVQRSSLVNREGLAMRRALNLWTVSIGVSLLLAAVTLPGCGGSAGDEPPGSIQPPEYELRSTKARVETPSVSSADAATLAADNLAFSLDLYHELRLSKPGNLIYSQTSISTALAMLYAGAATSTATQMSDALHFSLPAPRLHAAFNALDLALTTPPPGSSAAAFRLNVANSIWLQDGFTVLPPYLDTLAENYGAGLFTENFQTAWEPARTAINRWVSGQTEDLIPTLFPEGSINSLTRLVLANAVFFHGDWKKAFAKDSQNRVFHAPTGDVSVPTMYGSMNASAWNGPGWSAARVDYVGDTTSMVIVVPDAGTFAAFEAGLTAESLGAILAGAQSASGTDLYLPRFKFGTDVDLSEVLSALGMPVAFNDGADFSGINGARDLRIQAVVHKALIEVDEQGTTAAAATGVSVGVTSLPPTLVVDRPFLFFVRHHATGAILFQGRVLNPAQ
jgi:serpin B